MSVGRRVMWLGALVAAAMLVAPSAWATDGPEQLRPNDVDLTGFLDFEHEEEAMQDDDRVWGHAVRDDEGFRKFARDLGQVFAPRLVAPSETLGQAGFAVKGKGSLSHIPRDESYWKDGLSGGKPNPVLTTIHLHVRKGLPFSFEIGGNLSHLFNSNLYGMGADIRWALHEGYQYFPDIAVRGGVNTLTGAPQLNLINFAWDISISKSTGLGGVVELTGYGGYQQLHTWASSRVVSAYPQDPRPPQTLEDNGTEVNFSPEAVFDAERQFANRYFLGARLNTWILSFTAEAILADPVNQFTLSLGADF